MSTYISTETWTYAGESENSAPQHPNFRYISIVIIFLYFSFLSGIAIAGSWKDDPTAAFKLLEPDRNVPARDWKSPYCTVWGDGCTRCTKATAKSKPVCTAISEEQRCAPKKIECDSADWNELRRLCAGPAYIKADEYGNVVDVTYCDFDFEVDKRTGSLKSREQGVCMSVIRSNWQKVLGENIVASNLPKKNTDNLKSTRQNSSQTLICTYPQFYDHGWIITRSGARK